MILVPRDSVWSTFPNQAAHGEESAKGQRLTIESWTQNALEESVLETGFIKVNFPNELKALLWIYCLNT